MRSHAATGPRGPRERAVATLGNNASYNQQSTNGRPGRGYNHRMRWLATSITILLVTAGRPDAHTEMWWRNVQVQQTLHLTSEQVARLEQIFDRDVGLRLGRPT